MPYETMFLDGKQGMAMLVLKWVDENGLQARWQNISLAAQPDVKASRTLTRSDAGELRNRRISNKDAA